MKNFFDAFISYGRDDSKAFATKLNEKLTAQGLNVWFDQEDIEDTVKWQKAIARGIEKSHNFIFIVAPHAVKSRYCLEEIELAVKYCKRLIPLLYIDPKDCWEQLHPAIGEVQFIPFQKDNDDFEESFTRLKSVIDKQEEYVHQHTKFLVQALEWQRNQQQTNYLLVGEERQEAEAWLRRRFANEQPPRIPTDLQCEFIGESTKNANNLMTQVFLSYSDKDEEIKEKIRQTLMRECYTIWMNKTDIKTGTAFQEAINQGIEGADNFVYLLSPDSLESEYCMQELSQALTNNKRIIPLLIDSNLKIPPTSLEKGSNTWTELYNQLKELQSIDLTGHEEADKYQEGVDKLLAELKKEPSYYEKQKTLLVKTLKWQRQNRNPSLLLRGYNLQQFEAWLKVTKLRDDYPPLPLQEEFITASLNQPESISLEVFISYSRSDSDLARKLNDGLQELGKTTWFDQESIATGTDFQQEIYHGIESSDNFLFIISPKSINSPYCAGEVEYAQKLGKRFVTILHRNLGAKDKQNLPPALANVQYLDFNHHGGEFAANFNEFVRTLDTDRDHVRSHSKWSQRALEWQKKGGEERLLRGSELAIAQNWLEEAQKNNKQPPPTQLQKKFIGASGELQNRQETRRKREIIFAWAVTGLAIVGAMASTYFGLEAQKQALNAELQAQATNIKYGLSVEPNPEELIEAIEATAKSQAKQKSLKPTVMNEVNSSLLAALDLVRERNLLQGHIDTVRGREIAFSPDGTKILSSSIDTTVRLWDTESGKLLHTLEGHTGLVTAISFSADGKYILSGSGDRTVRLWLALDGPNLLKEVCNQLQFHPALVAPKNESAGEACLKYAGWQDTVKAEFLVRQGWAILQIEQNIKVAVTKFNKAQKLHPDIDLNPDTEEIEKDPEAVAEKIYTTINKNQSKPNRQGG